MFIKKVKSLFTKKNQYFRKGNVKDLSKIFPLEVFKANYCHCHDVSLSLFAHLNSHVNQLFPESIFPSVIAISHYIFSEMVTVKEIYNFEKKN